MFHAQNPPPAQSPSGLAPAPENAVEQFGGRLSVLSRVPRDDLAALAAFLDKYRDCSPHTRRAYAKESHRFLLWLRWQTQSSEATLLAQCGKEEVNAYRDVLVAGGLTFPKDFLTAQGWPSDRPPWAKPGTPASPATVSHALLILRLLFLHLQDEGYVLTNPSRAARKVRRSSAQNVRLKEAFTVEEWAEVLAVIEALPQDTPRDRAHYHRARWVMQLLYRAFLRREEAASLRMGDFVGQREHWELHFVGKGNKAAEIVATSRLMEELKRYRVSLGLGPLPGAHETRPAILDIHGLRGVTADTIYRICVEIFTRAAMVTNEETRRQRFLAASPHWLRHTGISHAMEAGVDPRRVQAQARHASLTTTTSIYDHKERTVWAREMERVG